MEIKIITEIKKSRKKFGGRGLWGARSPAPTGPSTSQGQGSPRLSNARAQTEHFHVMTSKSNSVSRETCHDPCQNIDSPGVKLLTRGERASLFDEPNLGSL